MWLPRGSARREIDEGANLILGACDYQKVFRLNDNASAKWMSDRIGVVDVTVTSESVDDDWVERTTTSSTEPKVFPHELQQLYGDPYPEKKDDAA